jgi:trk system potassium uptake protein
MHPHNFITLGNITIWSFAGLIAVGTFLLILPQSVNGPALTPVDALFTATSATCVTGLVVVDTGSRLSLFGQWVVLVLIQIGGLGFMTLSTVIILSLGGKFSLLGRRAFQETFTLGPDTRLPTLIRDVVKFTLVLETAGTLLLYLRFAEIYSPGQALYHAVFHSISAFCNAGFGLFPDSLMGFRADPLVSLTVSILIIAGGIGFLVLMELKSRFARTDAADRSRRLSLHSKLVLALTGLLLAAGTVWFLTFEWHGAMAGLSIPVKVMVAFFQSVTARTAGFNTLDFGTATNATLLFTIFLMFVGAATGSTGGGIKITTLGVLLALGRSRLYGRETTPLFRRTLSRGTEAKAIGVYAVSIVLIYCAVMAIMVSEAYASLHSASPTPFLTLLFETVSAFGTVGLSLGITPELSAWNKTVLVMVMFTGRLGPLTIAYSVSSRQRTYRYRYAEDRVMIG